MNSTAIVLLSTFVVLLGVLFLVTVSSVQNTTTAPAVSAVKATPVTGSSYKTVKTPDLAASAESSDVEVSVVETDKEVLDAKNKAAAKDDSVIKTKASVEVE